MAVASARRKHLQNVILVRFLIYWKTCDSNICEQKIHDTAELMISVEITLAKL